MKGAERDGMLGRWAARALGGAETRGRTERLSEGRNEARACPMMPSLLIVIIPRRIGEGGMGEEGEVPPFTKLSPSLRFPLSFLFPPWEKGREEVGGEG